MILAQTLFPLNECNQIIKKGVVKTRVYINGKDALSVASLEDISIPTDISGLR